ncbi:MAG: hypothetical protein MJ076_03565 [Clostridia bacterium]|nr:hypothetical protein [Clostridia bacterium]
MKFFSSNSNNDGDFLEFLDNENNKDEISLEKFNSTRPSHVLTPEEVESINSSENNVVATSSNGDALKSLKERMSKFSKKETLLEKCKPYTLDEQGNDMSKPSAPLYELESVADILRSKGEKALDELSKKYDVSIDALGKNKEPEIKTKTETVPNNADIAQGKPVPEKTIAFEKLVSDSKETEKPKINVKQIFSQDVMIDELDFNLPDISDIDTRTQKRAEEVNEDRENLSNTPTIRFTPVKNTDGNKNRISVSSTTKPIDITAEIDAMEDISSNSAVGTELQLTNFDEYLPRQEYKSFADTKKIIRDFSIKKRSAFISAVLSGLCTFILSIFLIPPLNDVIISYPKNSNIFSGIVLLVSLLANIKIFSSFANAFTKNSNGDFLATVCTLSTLFLVVISFVNNIYIFEIVFLVTLILFVRSLCNFFDASSMLGNLRQIATKNSKKAVSLISDKTITFAMAKNAIEGDVLVAVPRNTEFVSDYFKYSTFGTRFNGKLSIITILSLIIALISGIVAYTYFDGIYYGVYTFTVILSLASLPSLFFIDTLPSFSAAKRLNKKGAMIAGKTAAEKLELANAVVVNSTDIFPSGTVTLQNIKVLSDNSIDDTLLKAASLTDAVGSTLAPIFKKIAGTNSAYSIPNSDTVKYEERLGLSGWVDDELLFIGNRTLMEAHGIPMPNIEIDRKILRKGYFPVYLASGGKACALLIIQYSVNPIVAREFKRITNLGVTVLVSNCDPNINEEMICDYLGLYDDSVKVMSNAGVHMYKNTVSKVESCSAPASFRTGNLTFITIMNCASRMKKTNTLLTVFYVLFFVLGTAVFIYSAFSGSANLINSTAVLLYELSATLLSLIVFIIRKP